ncbi:MAG TPA: phosphoheptose isomerase [Acidimicrobiaceae bacterium]|nr:phosphoheptose isomerase [Acidimicrobiaceae bacterium]
MSDFFSSYFSGLAEALVSVAPDDLLAATDLVERVGGSGRKVIIVGNGGSAAIASHVAVDLTKAAGVRAVTFHDPGLITCYANDYGYENWVAEAIGSYADEGDAAILISSSGCSENIVNGSITATELGLPVITFSGFEATNPLRSMGEVNFWVDSSDYNVVETTHQIWLLAVVDCLIDRSVVTT